MENKKISVIIPVYNVEKYIRQCLESVINQTYKNLEIIIVNDGTKDNSIKIVEEYLSDGRIKVINKENGGISSARNKGIKEATGEYIHFLDSDDWIKVNLYEELIKNIKDEDIVIFNHAEFDNDKQKIKSKKKIKILNNFNSKKSGAIFLGNVPNGCWLKIYSLEFIKKNNFYFDEKLKVYEDMLWDILTLISTKKVNFIDIVGLYYRIKRENSLVNSTYNILEIKQYKRLIIKKLKEELEKNTKELIIKKIKFYIMKLEIEIEEKNDEYWKKNFIEDIKYFMRNNTNMLDKKFYKKEIRDIMKINYKKIELKWFYLKYDILGFKVIKCKIKDLLGKAIYKK